MIQLSWLTIDWSPNFLVHCQHPNPKRQNQPGLRDTGRNQTGSRSSEGTWGKINLQDLKLSSTKIQKYLSTQIWVNVMELPGALSVRRTVTSHAERQRNLGTVRKSKVENVQFVSTSLLQMLVCKTASSMWNTPYKFRRQ